MSSTWAILVRVWSPFWETLILLSRTSFLVLLFLSDAIYRKHESIELVWDVVDGAKTT